MNSLKQDNWRTVLKDSIYRRFNLHADQASNTDIDNNIRAGVDLVGATPWILICAIFLASIGLNVNSTAVIIGAMLISPLMGPIMGIGYGVGIYDFALFKKSLTNLLIATLISLATATIYFLLSPLEEAQSELFARTTPTFWDVLIALFGGLAGMIGASRKEKSNIVPGVAIATALMPPLCTAGYGLAHANWEFFFGALYLFAINSVFIAVATTIVCTFLHLPQRNFVDPHIEKRVKRSLYLIVTLTMLPSCYLAYQMVSDMIFKSQASRFVQQELKFDNAIISNISIQPAKESIEITLLGETLDDKTLAQLQNKLTQHGLKNAKLHINQNKLKNSIDIAALKEGMLKELYQKSVISSQEKDLELETLRNALKQQTNAAETTQNILSEFNAQYPEVKSVSFAYSQAPNQAETSASRPTLLIAQTNKLTHADQKRIIRWLQTRTNNPDAQLLFYQIPTPQIKR